MPRAKQSMKPIPQTQACPLQHLEERSVPRVLHETLDFEEALDPPDLEDALAH